MTARKAPSSKVVVDNSQRKALFAISGIMFFIAVLAGIWFVFGQRPTKAPADTTSLSDLFREENEAYTYTPFETYTSFDYGFQFEYNREQYRLESWKTSVSLRPTNLALGKSFDLKMYDYIAPSVELSDHEMFVNERTETLNSVIEMRGGSLVELGTENVEGMLLSTYKYSFPAFGDEEIVSACIFFVHDGIGYDLRVTPFDDNAVSAGVSFVSAIQFVDTSELDSTAQYVSNSGGYGFTYDRKEWDAQEYSNAVYLNWKQEGIYDINRVIVSYLDGFESLDIYVDRELDVLEAGSEEMEIIEMNDVEFAEKTAKKVELNYKSKFSSGEQYLVVHYIVIEDRGYQIRGDFSGRDSDAFTSYESILESFRFIGDDNNQSQTDMGVVDTGNFSDEGVSEDNVCGGLFVACAQAEEPARTPKVQIPETELVTSLNKPAVARVINDFCVTYTIPYDPALQYSSNTELGMCSMAHGTGFFVESSGYIATNGHVVMTLPNETLLAMAGYGYLNDFAIKLIRDLALYDGYDLSYYDASLFFEDDPAYYLILSIVAIDSLLKDGFASYTSENDYYVQYTEEDLILTAEGFGGNEQPLVAMLVDYKYDDISLDVDSTSSGSSADVALLKVTSEYDFPIVNLGETGQLTEGLDVIVLGYPGIVDDAIHSFSSTQMNQYSFTGKMTVTRGVVSAIHQNLDLIQIDASVSGGNSGGPGFGLSGDVVGMVTYGVNSAGAADYNYLRVIEEIKGLMDDNGVENKGGKVDKLWRDGMDALLAENFAVAVENFREVKRLFPGHKSIDRYLAQAEELHEKYPESEAMSNEGLFGLDTTTTIIVLVGGGALVLGVVLVIVAVVINRNKKDKQTLPPPPPVPASAVPSHPPFGKDTAQGFQPPPSAQVSASVSPSAGQSTQSSPAISQQLPQQPTAYVPRPVSPYPQQHSSQQRPPQQAVRPVPTNNPAPAPAVDQSPRQPVQTALPPQPSQEQPPQQIVRPPVYLASGQKRSSPPVMPPQGSPRARQGATGSGVDDIPTLPQQPI